MAEERFHRAAGYAPSQWQAEKHTSTQVADVDGEEPFTDVCAADDARNGELIDVRETVFDAVACEYRDTDQYTLSISLIVREKLDLQLPYF